jgi:hypothetical protein
MAVLNHAPLSPWLARLWLLLALLLAPPCGWAEEGPLTGNEKELKVAFLYNFALFTDWPPEVGGSLVFCLLGADALSREVDALQGRVVQGRATVVQRKVPGESLKNCQVLFIGAQAIGGLAGVLEELRDRPVLTVADSVGATRQGVALNMLVERNKVSFEANLQPVRLARLQLSSKLLRLATRVYP